MQRLTSRVIPKQKTLGEAISLLSEPSRPSGNDFVFMECPVPILLHYLLTLLVPLFPDGVGERS